MPWYLYLAIKQLFPTGRRFPFFTAISVAGVTLGVALLVVVMSVMGGFGYEIHRMIIGRRLLADARRRAGSLGFSGHRAATLPRPHGSRAAADGARPMLADGRAKPMIVARKLSARERFTVVSSPFLVTRSSYKRAFSMASSSMQAKSTVLMRR